MILKYTISKVDGNVLLAMLAIAESRSPPMGLTGEVAPAACGVIDGISMSPNPSKALRGSKE